MTRKRTREWTADRWAVEDRGFTTACWVWRDGRTRLGYGKIKRDGVNLLAHRFAWTREHGPIPKGLELDHLCRVRACVNPEHLELVTHAENVRRGAMPKLTAEDVVRIREELAAGRRQQDIAETFGVGRGAIADIATNRTWRGVH